jgi:hypothetical protein
MEGELDPTLTEEEMAQHDGGLSKSERNKKIKAGLYPKPLRTGPNGRKRFWFLSDAHAVQARLRAERDKPFTGIKRGPKGRIAKKAGA